MTRTELLIGYGSLLSKKGVTREGSAPRIHRAWAVLLPGRRGFSKTFRDGRKVVLDASLDEAKVLDARPLDGYLEGRASPPRDLVPATDEQPAFEGVAFEVDAADWTWYAEREEFPAGLGTALAEERDRRGVPITALLAETVADAGFEGYPRALFDRYKEHLLHPEWTDFATHYIPYPLHMPEADALGGSLPHDWAIVCAVPEKEHPLQAPSAAALRPGIDQTELLWYYHDCMLGERHGLDLSDLRDDAFERDHPELRTMLADHAEDEHRPLDWFLGNLPKGALPKTAPAERGHDMRPLDDLIPYDEAQRILAALPLPRMRRDDHPLDSTDGRVLLDDVRAAVDVPGFDKSAMDGYAVRAEDTYGASLKAPRVLECIGTQHAGRSDPQARIETGQCIQIATGAPLPPGAEAVVMVEATTRDGRTVSVHRAHRKGQNVVARGSDLAKGNIVLQAGTRLDPSRIAALGAVGVSQVALHARPRVAVVSTGDEVVPPGRDLGPGQVHDANNHALAAFCRRLGCDVTRVTGVSDTRQVLEDALHRAVEEHDLVVFTGGTSAGERDLLPRILAEHGEVLFHGIKIRPGKPVVAARIGEKPVIGLPGYPTSCLLVAETLLAPLLDRLGGATTPRAAPTMESVAAEPLHGQEGWHQWIPVRRTPDGVVPCFRGSAAVTSLSEADGYVTLDVHTGTLPAGSKVLVHGFR